MMIKSPPSAYKSGESLTGHKVHAVAPGTTYRPNPMVKLAKSLCGQRVFPSYTTFDPKAVKACGRCAQGVRVRKGRGA
jgi:hypothetical protein